MIPKEWTTAVSVAPSLEMQIPFTPALRLVVVALLLLLLLLLLLSSPT